MNPRVKAVEPQPDYKLRLTFANGEERQFDMKPYLDTGVFQALRDPVMFNTVRPFLGSIQWQNEADLCPDTLYERSVPLRPAKAVETGSALCVAKMSRPSSRKDEPAKIAEAPVKYVTRRRK